MPSDSGLLQQLIAMWRNESNTPLEPPMSLDELRALFAKHGFRATQDVCDLYSTIGGMANGCSDDRMFELWCRDRIDKENYESKWEYLWFGDWLISSHLYALKPVDARFSEIYIDHQCDRITRPKLVAHSVYEFAERLIYDPASVGVVL